MDDSKSKVVLVATTDDVGSEISDLVSKKDGTDVSVVKTLQRAIDVGKEKGVDIVVLDISDEKLGGYTFIEMLNKSIIRDKLPMYILIANSIDDVDSNKNITYGVEEYVIKSTSTVADIGTKLISKLGKGGKSDSKDPLHDKGFKILAVEDDNFLRDLLARKLNQENCQFIAAIDGENALKMIDEEKPSIILLDLILPGIDGFEVLTKIHENPDTKDVPVIVLSNLGQDSDIKRAKELGAADFLIKANFSIDEVIDRIKKLIAEKKV